jgi:pyruvate dehydrogenase E2 component (dihydrolipoamide acetyltransferase)
VAHEFRLPDLGEGLTEGEVARWLVAEGERVEEDQPLVEIQTDKTTVEVPSPYAGTVLKIVVAEGEVAPVGAVLVVIGAAGEQLLRPVETPTARARAGVPEPLVAVVRDRPAAAVRATPAVRKLAAELGVDLLGVQGSGPGGRVTDDDVRLFATAPAAEGTRVPIRGIRRLIVEQVSRTHREVPAVTFVEECDFTGADLDTLVAQALKAAALALQEFPELNARLVGDDIVLLDRYDLGIAVQTEDGLVVPVVRSCDSRSVADIDADVRRLADAARAGMLAPNELRGSTFTVSSAGRLGGIFVTPLINHPEVAILGVHRIGPRPVVRDGEIVIREMGNVSVTFDHRVVDGLRAAAFCLDVIARLGSGPVGAGP